MIGLWLVDAEKWLAAYDPDGGDPCVAYPTGTIEWTDDPRLALAFDDAAAALEAWRRPSTRTPIRPDGRPNRPLTALTVEPRSLSKPLRARPGT